MTDAEILSVLKMDLQISTTSQDSYLGGLVETARGLIIREGVTLGDSVEDGMLVEMYAAWLWRKRRAQDGTNIMPRPLRWALNNRQFGRKGAADDG